MKHVTLPSTLKAWKCYSRTVNGRTVYVLSGQPTSEKEVDLPGFWYDQRGHNTVVVQSVVEDVTLDPEESIGLPGKECYINSSSPVLHDARMLSNGISYHAEYQILASDTYIMEVISEVRHGINADFLQFTQQGWLWEFDHWINDRFVQVRYYQQLNYQYREPCRRDTDARGIDPPSPSSLFSPGDFTFRTRMNDRLYGNVTIGYKLPSMYLGRYIFEYNESDWAPPNSNGVRPERCTELMGQALRSAVDQFPRYADNNVGNISEMTSMVIDLLKGNAPGVLDSLSKMGKSKRATGKLLKDAWLGYRYSYCTTKSDTQQALDALARKQITYLKPLRFDGKATGPLIYRGVGECTCRVGFDVVQQTTDLLRSVKHGLWMAGLEVNAYTIYDMIPFSFVVDWFTGWGDQLESKVVGDHYSDYVFSNMCWSLKYYYTKDSCSYKCYTRWYEDTTPSYTNKYNHVSGKTWLKRTLDGIALVYH